MVSSRKKPVRRAKRKERGQTAGRAGASARERYPARHRIEIFRQANLPEVSDADIRRVVRTTLKAHRARDAELSIALMDAAHVRHLNAEYLHRRRDTDVLSFDLRDDPGDRCRVSGQIVVNVRLARRRAARYRIDPAAEVMLYIVHGCLHLLGYDDHNPDQAAEMHRQEDDLLEQLGYGRTFAALRDARRRPL
jgi:probable rRNA maturation factor